MPVSTEDSPTATTTEALYRAESRTSQGVATTLLKLIDSLIFPAPLGVDVDVEYANRTGYGNEYYLYVAIPALMIILAGVTFLLAVLKWVRNVLCILLLLLIVMGLRRRRRRPKGQSSCDCHHDTELSVRDGSRILEPC